MFVEWESCISWIMDGWFPLYYSYKQWYVGSRNVLLLMMTTIAMMMMVIMLITWFFFLSNYHRLTALDSYFGWGHNKEHKALGCNRKSPPTKPCIYFSNQNLKMMTVEIISTMMVFLAKQIFCLLVLKDLHFAVIQF